MDDNSGISKYALFAFFSCLSIMGIYLKVTTFQNMHSRKHPKTIVCYNAKMSRFFCPLMFRKISTFLSRNNCLSCRRVTFAQTRNRIARIMLVVEHKKLTISALFVFWICWSIRIQDPTKTLYWLRETQNEVFSWCKLWNKHDFRRSAHRHRTCKNDKNHSNLRYKRWFKISSFPGTLIETIMIFGKVPIDRGHEKTWKSW